MDYSTLTLGELLSHANETIRRNAMSILKTLQREETPHYCEKTNCDNLANEGYAYCRRCIHRMQEIE